MDDLPDNHPESYADHGTRIAGAIGAITSNRTGVAGVMWNCKIMPLKMVSSLSISYPYIGTIFDFSTTALPVSTAMAIDYAVNHGAHVINMSYGISGLGYSLAVVTGQLSPLYDAISNAYDNNVVLVAAMGNEYGSGNPIEYPAGFHEVIAVGQTNSSLQRVSSSNTGPNIDVSAPGTYHTTSRNNSYNVLNGTSSATPVVSGVAGLIISQGLDRSFNLTNDDVKHILEITADDIYPTGWDENTGFGKVNAYNALQLLDEPNYLYHYTSTGGTSVKLQTLDKWILIGNCGGLVPGMYFSVDQYRITKHVTFDVPFCSTPRVWMRERQSKSLSYGNPNDGRPYCIITNVSNTGFDIEYAAYYVRYNLLGQTLNTWVPAAPASTYIAYTAVGIPSPTISGPRLVCSSGASFTVNNPGGSSIVWEPGPGLQRVSSQGSNPCTFSSTGNGNSWIRTTLTTGCGSIPITYTVWAGTPQIAGYTGQVIVDIYTGRPVRELCYGTHNDVEAAHPISYAGVTDWDWQASYGQVFPYGADDEYATVYPNDYQNFMLEVRASNTCGYSDWADIHFEIVDCGSYSLVFAPNPTTGETTLSIESKSKEKTFDETAEWEMEIYNQSQLLMEKKTRQYGQSARIQAASWKEGVYIVRVLYKGEVLTGRLIVTR